MKKLRTLSVNHAPWPVVIRHAAQNRCVSGTRNACQEQNSYLTRTNSLTIIHLANCVSGVSCVSGVFKFILELVSNTVLFLKKNFNSKLPDTHDTHLWNYYKPSLFVVEHPTHTPVLPDTHLTHMALFLTHNKNIELNVNRISRISDTMSTNTRPHRWSLSSGVITMKTDQLEVIEVLSFADWLEESDQERGEYANQHLRLAYQYYVKECLGEEELS